MTQLDTLPVTSHQVQQKKRIDPILSKVQQYTKRGWPSQTPKELELYKNRKLSSLLKEIVSSGVFQWSVQLSCKVLYFINLTVVTLEWRRWSLWHGATYGSTTLTGTSQGSSVVLLHPWEWPTKLWQRIHLDFAGPFKGKIYFILIDSHSKWPEVFDMSLTLLHRVQSRFYIIYLSCWLTSSISIG